ncbi:MAG: MFS transporter [Casimicrobiaceae bacterium]
MRLGVALLIGTIGGASLYIITVILPTLQKDFGVSRGDASLPYMFTLIGFGLGGLLMGRLADRFGVMVPLLIGAVSLGVGFPLAAMATNIWTLALVHGVLIGLLGSSAMFSPLIADTSLWFTRRRGIAVAICASGNYLAGTIWPPVVQHFVAGYGWRATYQGIGMFAVVSITVLALLMRRRPPVVVVDMDTVHATVASPRPFGLTPAAAQTVLCVAGVACCVAMSMPQVHIVAYCADLGFGVARGAQMLSVMLGFGIISRLVSGAICDRIGGLRTLLLGSALQGVALLLFLPFDGLVSLFVIAALFGLFQGGIVPAYAIIIREYFPAKEAGGRVGTVLMFTLFGMALGGWMSGKVFDLTGSYNAAFINGIAWNLLNLTIAVTLLRRVTPTRSKFHLRGTSRVVVQHPARPLSLSDRAILAADVLDRDDQ